MSELINILENSSEDELDESGGNKNDPVIVISSATSKNSLEKSGDVNSTPENSERSLVEERISKSVDGDENVIGLEKVSEMEVDKSGSDDEDPGDANKFSSKKNSKAFRLRIDSESDGDDDDAKKDLVKANSESEMQLTEEKSSDSSKNSNAVEIDKDESGNLTSEGAKKSNYSRLKMMDDSDSDDDEIKIKKNEEKQSEDVTTKSQVPAWKGLIDDDSDSGEDAIFDSKTIGSKSKGIDKSKKAGTVDSESENSRDGHSNKSNMIDRLAGLVDSESEEDEHVRSKNHSDEETNDGKKKSKEKKEPKRTGSHRAAMKKAMQEIKSESQRMVREQSLSIPYHKPKQISLSDVLKRRSIAEVLPHGLPMSTLMKKSVADISKALEEKEKEAELLYESSDSENEDKTEIKNDDKPKEKSPTLLDISESCEQSELKGRDAVSRQLFTENEKDSSEFSSLTNSSIELIQNNKNVQEFVSKNTSSTASNKLSDDAEHAKSDSCEDKTDKTSNNTNLVNLLETEKSQDLDPKSSEITNTISKNSLTTSSKSNFESMDLSEVENGSDLPRRSNSDDEKKEPAKVSEELASVKRKRLINVSKITPRLSGGPGMDIDLSATKKPNKKAINELMNRYFSKHTATPKSNADSEVTVLQTEITSEGVKISKSVLPYKITVKETIEDPELNKPGAKFKRLQDELKKKMADKRGEEWKKKEQQAAFINDEEVEEEEEILEDYSTDGESEPEENDIPIVDKKRKSHMFNDEEAEVSDDENLELSDDEEEDLSDNNDVELEEDEKDEDEDGTIDPTKQKKFSRIIVDEDSADEEQKALDDKMETIEEDSLLSPKVVPNSDCQTPQTKPRPTTISESPFTESQINDILNCSQTPMKSQYEKQEQNDQRKKLFNVPEQTVTDEDLLAICSGKFTEVDSSQNAQRKKLFNVPEQNVTDEDLLAMCSGKFTGVDSSQSVPKSSGLFSSFSVTDSEIMKTALSEPISQTDLSTNESQNVKSVGVDDFDKEKSESAVFKVNKEVNKIILDFASSSEDEGKIIKVGEKKKKVLKKKKPVKLVLSDDEDEKSDDEYSEEEEEEEVMDEEEEKFIEYDSDENEVVVIPSKDIKKVAAKFVEDEAELSGSEEGSDDENEEDLDKLELEEGDVENIDEDQMRNQLGKIHAMHLLDKDKREVKDLQELLFDDGELYSDGSGRERKFKWKNNNKFDSDFLGPSNDDNDNIDDDIVDGTEFMSELDWRKYRLEREKFLKAKAESVDSLENDMASSNLLRHSMKILQKRKSVQVTEDPNVSTTVTTTTTIIEDRFKKVTKKGSFLARKEEELSRVALMLKQTNDDVNKTKKNASSFVFSVLSPTVDNSEEKEVDKWDATSKEKQQNEENIQKKIRKRKVPTGDTPKISKKAKLDGIQRGKKLF